MATGREMHWVRRKEKKRVNGWAAARARELAVGKGHLRGYQKAQMTVSQREADSEDKWVEQLALGLAQCWVSWRVKQKALL